MMNSRLIRHIASLAAITFSLLTPGVIADTRPHVVFLAGDDEYRSEESMPMLASLLEQHYGFRTSVVYSVDPDTGFIDPGEHINMPGLEVLASADLMVAFLRFRKLPEESLAHINAYLDSGRPLVAFRTTTHAFRYNTTVFDYIDWWPLIWLPLDFLNTPTDERLVATYNEAWPRKWVGQTWITHHGHFDDGENPLTEVSLVAGKETHPVLRGVKPFAAYSWLYHMEGAGDSISGDIDRLLTGRSLKSNKLDKEPPYPMSNPVAWTRLVDNEQGETTRVFYTSLGHPYDFHDVSMRKLAVNGIFWALQREADIPAEGTEVTLVEDYNPPNSGEGTGSYREERSPD